MQSLPIRPVKYALLVLIVLLPARPTSAQQNRKTVPSNAANRTIDVLSERQWRDVDRSVHLAPKWMASQQRRDGSFPTLAPAG